MAERTPLYVSKNNLSPRLQRMLRQLDHPEEGFRKGVDAMHESVLEEFATESYFPPSGGRIAWKPQVPFGTKPTSPILRRSGRYLRALTGGKDSVTRITKQGAGIGVRGEALRLMQIHRGSLGRNPSPSKVTVVKALEAQKHGDRYPSTDPRFWAMYWALRFKFGVRVGYNKLRRVGFRIPARPHMAMNPALAKRLKAIMRDHIVAGSAS